MLHVHRTPGPGLQQACLITVARSASWHKALMPCVYKSRGLDNLAAQQQHSSSTSSDFDSIVLNPCKMHIIALLPQHTDCMH